MFLLATFCYFVPVITATCTGTCTAPWFKAAFMIFADSESNHNEVRSGDPDYIFLKDVMKRSLKLRMKPLIFQE